MRKSRTLSVGAASVAALALAASGIQAASAAPEGPGRVTSTRPLAETGAAAKDAVAAARDTASALVGDDQDLTVADALVDSTGATHVRMKRSYEGLRVVGGDLVIHRAADGDVLGTSQTLKKSLTLSAKPTTSAASALAKVGTTLKQAGSPELVVDATSSPRLAWLVTTTGTQSDGTPSRIDSYVDARSGSTIRSEQRIQTIEGEGRSLYGGTVPLDLTPVSGAFQLKDATRGNTYTIDVNNKTDGALCSLMGIGCATGTVFSSPDTSFGTGSTGSRESAAVDAQYGTDATWDYFKNTFGRNGIFGTGKGSYNRVHYGKNYVNAFGTARR